MVLRIALSIFLMLSLNTLLAQHYHVPFDHFNQLRYEREMTRKGMGLATSMKPYRTSAIQPVVSLDSAIAPAPLKWRFARTFVGRKLFSEDLVRVYAKNFALEINPAFDFTVGVSDNGERRTWNNSRGLTARGNLGSKVSFYTEFYENQAVFAGYVGRFVDSAKVTPGMGRPKKFGDNGHDFAFATGYVRYQPTEFIGFELGHGKHFIGDGYRSHILSDAGYNYPYFKIETEIWKFKYVNLWAEFTDLSPLMQSGGADGIQNKKFGTFHYLIFQPVDGLEIGLFESIIWRGGVDSLGNSRGFDFNYLNPVIFYRPVEFGLGSEDNALLGLNLRWNFLKHYQFYGQVVLDEFNLSAMLGKPYPGWRANKQAFQAGLKYFDAFGLKNLHLRSEFNLVRPYMYSHFKSVASNYGHYNQPLAHPMGSNFWEINAGLEYTKGRFAFRGRLSYAKKGLDPNDGIHYGGNIFELDDSAPWGGNIDGPDGVGSYGNYVGQGLTTEFVFVETTASYLVNPASGLRVELGMLHRSQTNSQWSTASPWIWFGLKTRLPNRYFDWL